MAAAMVEVLGRCWVKPAKATKRHNCTLSPLGVFWSDYGYAKTVHFFKLRNRDDDNNDENNINMDEVAEALKRSLSGVLCEYYSVAGRLRQAPNDDDADDSAGRTRGMPRMVVDCNNAGVEFVTARCLGVTYADLEATGFQQVQPLFQSLGPPRNRIQDPQQDPLVSIQVTFFPDRGISIAILTDHTLFDGFSYNAFLKAWGECHSQSIQTYAAQGQKDVTEPAFTLSNPPLHMHGALLLGTTGSVDDDRASKLDDEDKLDAAAAASSISTRIVPMKYGYKYFTSLGHQLRREPPNATISVVKVGTVSLSAQTVEEIKRSAAAGRNMLRPFTTFECLAAYLWKRRVLAAARGSLIRGEDQDRLRVGLRFPVNLRLRPTPLRLPPGYFGLAALHVAVVPAPTARQLSQESLSATAARIRRAIELYTTDSSMRQQIRAYQEGDMRNVTAFAAYISDWQRPTPAQAHPHHASGDLPDQTVTCNHSNYDSNTFVTEIPDARRLSLHEVDFGPDMPLDAVKPLAHRDEGVITIAPATADPAAACIFANLRSSEVEAFCAFNEPIV